jgi:hypothetical protein
VQRLVHVPADGIIALTPGTANWLDLKQAAITGGTAQLINVGCEAFQM